MVLTVLDLWLYGSRFVGTKPPAGKNDILPGAAVEELIKDPDYPRVAQSVDNNANLLYGVRALFRLLHGPDEFERHGGFSRHHRQFL